MELFIANNSVFVSLYNCSAYSVDDVPLQQRQNIPVGVFFSTIGIFEELLYVPCLAAIWRLAKENACYKVMLVMGLLDLFCLPMNAIATGWLGIVGAVYCSYSRTIYVLGAYGSALWYAESTLELLLALNRCLELTLSQRAMALLFGGQRIWCWIAPPLLYAIYTFFESRVATFTGIYQSWFFDPHVGYLSETSSHTYENVQHLVHNSCVAVGLCLTYIVFAIVLLHRTLTIGRVSISAKNKIFLQVALISSINAAASSIFVYMNFYPTPKFLIIAAQFLWIQAHGFKPVIYLAMNSTIRAECRRLFCPHYGAEVAVVSAFPVSTTHYAAILRKEQERFNAWTSNHNHN